MRVVRAAGPRYYLVAEMMTGTCSDECDESYSGEAPDDDHHNHLMTDQSRDWTLIFSNCHPLLHNSS